LGAIVIITVHIQSSPHSGVVSTAVRVLPVKTVPETGAMIFTEWIADWVIPTEKDSITAPREHVARPGHLVDDDLVAVEVAVLLTCRQ
jgi:hypothetical protein